MFNVNTNLLKSQRVKCGFTQKQVSLKLGKDVTTYSKKENGFIEFTASEIAILKVILKLSLELVDEIFFNNEVAFSETISSA